MNRRRMSQEERGAQEALNQLRALQGIPVDQLPAPGGPPGAVLDTWSSSLLGNGVARLHGRYATLTLSGVTLLCFEWDVAVDQEFADGTAHGEYWDNPVPLKQMWSGTVRCYHASVPPRATQGTAGNWTTDMAAINLIYNASRISGDPASHSFVGYNGGVNAGQAIFSGACYASRANFSAPRNGMATQEFVMRGIATPNFGPAL